MSPNTRKFLQARSEAGDANLALDRKLRPENAPTTRVPKVRTTEPRKEAPVTPRPVRRVPRGALTRRQKAARRIAFAAGKSDDGEGAQ